MTPGIAYPSQRNLKNDLEVLERLLQSINGEKRSNVGGHDVTDLLKTISELEQYKLEYLNMYAGVIVGRSK